MKLLWHFCASMLLAACVCGATAASAEGVETLLVIEPGPSRPRNSEGDLVELADSRLALVYTRFIDGGRDNSQAELALRTSSDGGRTWSDDRVLVTNEGDENVMSVSLLRLNGGDALLFYLRKNGWDDCQLYVRRSSDGLDTLGEPVRCTVDDGYHVVNNARVARLASGRLLVPAAWHPCPDGTRASWSHRAVPRVYYSDDDGRTWQADRTAVAPLPQRAAVLQEPGAIELREGRILMYHRTDQGTQYQSFSRDGGLSWSEPEPGPLASPLSPATIARVPWSGELVCVWNDHSGAHPFAQGKRTPLCVATSRDEGRTWSASRAIENDPDGWYCYTSITFVGERMLLSYCAGDSQVGGLNRLKLTAVSRAWLDGE